MSKLTMLLFFLVSQNVFAGICFFDSVRTDPQTGKISQFSTIATFAPNLESCKDKGQATANFIYAMGNPNLDKNDVVTYAKFQEEKNGEVSPSFKFEGVPSRLPFMVNSFLGRKFYPYKFLCDAYCS